MDRRGTSSTPTDRHDRDFGDTAVASRFRHCDVLTLDKPCGAQGIPHAKSFAQYTVDDYANVTAVNLAGFFHITQRVIAQMLTQGHGGHIVNVTTTLVEHADRNVPSVLASLTKGGLAAATKSLAIEFAPNRIRVNAVPPGVIDAPMHPDDAHPVYVGMHRLGRMGSIADIVRGVLCLESATFVTGEFLHVDGGQSAGR